MSNETLQAQINELRTELTSVQTALSLVLSAEHRALVNSKDVRKVFKDMIREMREEEEHERVQNHHQRLAQQFADAQRTWTKLK
ncbi:MAG: hypothetical protein KAV87_10645 [Desulfobacteraceae bacterium]|nr:hypothetical protein [Desulfobacteraceae bacterium]